MKKKKLEAKLAKTKKKLTNTKLKLKSMMSEFENKERQVTSAAPEQPARKTANRSTKSS